MVTTGASRIKVSTERSRKKQLLTKNLYRLIDRIGSGLDYRKGNDAIFTDQGFDLMIKPTSAGAIAPVGITG
jgi:hypothetical protein